MCGIAGIVSFSKESENNLSLIEGATAALKNRGPNFQNTYKTANLALGHARLSIIDTSENAHQPFQLQRGKYTITYNGEFYNFREHRDALKKEGIRFKSESDTEVLLQLYVKHGIDFLQMINGFFALAIYDKEKDILLLARDRMGIKPLLYYKSEQGFSFASEMQAMIKLGIPKKIDKVSLFTYLQLNYIPAPNSIFQDVNKLLPGEYIEIENVSTTKPSFKQELYYQIPYSPGNVVQASAVAYKEAQEKLKELTHQAVEKRMVSDVPIGTFLSGGVDSSIISSIANQHSKKLNTYSIGFKDDHYFDETKYAKLVAKSLKTKHTVFKLSKKEMHSSLYDFLDTLDEPFADSSALAVYMLSQKTSKHITVALSGDGADELFAGYNKHFAEYKAQHPTIAERIIKGLDFVWEKIPQSRNNYLFNLNRKLYRFSKGLSLPAKLRYWQWAAFLNEEEANYFLKEKMIFSEQRLSDTAYDYKKRKDFLLKDITKQPDMNQVLLNDMHMLLPNDMLYKIDKMSMAHGLEVRTPFLDHELVEYCFTLPSIFKINGTMKKKILQDTFKKDLPAELYNRKKQGFEIPVLSWFKAELRNNILEELFEDEFIEQQNIFNLKAIKELKQKLFSKNPGDSHATVWALIVFQYWWKKHCSDA